MRDNPFDTPTSALRAFLAALRGFDSFPELLSSFLTQAPYLGHQGCIVCRSIPTEVSAIGYTLGLLVGDRVALVDTEGLIFVKIDFNTDTFWNYNA